MRISYHRPILTAALLVGACVLFAGCGDTDAYMPLDLVAGTGAAATTAAVTDSQSVLDDPVTQDVSLDDVSLTGDDSLATDALASEDPWAAANADWDDHEGSVTPAFSTDDFDDMGYAPVGYGPGPGYGGWDDGSLRGVSFSSAPGFVDPGVADPGVVDAGFEDPGFVDPGFADPGVVDPGFDAGVVDDPGVVF